MKYAAPALEDPRFDAQVGDARSLPFEDASFDAVVSGLVLNFVADQGGVAKEFARVAAPGARIGVYVWDYAGGMQMMRYFWDAAKELDPRAREQDEGERFAEIASLKGLGSLFDVAGLDDVRSRSIDIPTIFRDFDDYWDPFLAGQGPAPAYCASLDDGQQAELRELLRVRLPEQDRRHDPSHRTRMGRAGTAPGLLTSDPQNVLTLERMFDIVDAAGSPNAVLPRIGYGSWQRILASAAGAHSARATTP